MRGILVWMILIIILVCGEALGVDLKGQMKQSSPVPEGLKKEMKEVSPIPEGFKKGKSDLSIERIYLKDCKVFVVIRNRGTGGVSSEDYAQGKLIIGVTEAGNNQKEKNYNFFLREVDPAGILKNSQTQVEFDSKVACFSNAVVKARIEGLKDDANAGRKLLVQNIIPSEICKSGERIASSTSSRTSFSGAERSFSNVGAQVPNTGITQKGFSSQDLEKARRFEELEKAKKLETLKEAKGQRAFEAEKERRDLWERNEFKGGDKINPKGGPLRDQEIFGSGGPGFEDWWKKAHRGSGSPTTGPGPGGPQFETGVAGARNEKPRGVATEFTTVERAKSYGKDYPTHPDDHLRAATFHIAAGYAYQKEGYSEQAKENYKTAAEHLKEYYKDEGIDAVIVDVSNEGRVTVTLIDYDGKKEKMPLPPEQQAQRGISPPWSPHEKSKVRRKEEAQGIERSPHAIDVYHYQWEKAKEASERAGGLEVNPGTVSGMAGEIRHYNQGAETVWRFQTWATDPDFPFGAQMEQNEQMEQQKMQQEEKH